MNKWNLARLSLGVFAPLMLFGALGFSATGAGRAVLAEAMPLGANSSAGIDAGAGIDQVTGPGLGPIEITIGPDWRLDGKLLLIGQMTVRCGPFVPGTSGFSFASVLISQAAGHTVAHAFGSISPACDGVPRAYAVTAVAADVPFHPGTGVATAGATACGVDPFTFQFVCQSGQATSEISIRR